MRLLSLPGLILLAITSTHRGEAKDPEWAGPEKVSWEELQKGVALQVKSASPAAAKVWIITSDPAFAVITDPPDTSAKKPVNWNPGASLKIGVKAADKADPSDVERALWISV